jgi:prepilin-type N-terminal cleavage/methylation domain-containing protein
MHITNTKQHQQEAGFTLVELAIVMIIIGLLIGGILKGQELIANARSTATIGQVKSLDAAVSTFRDKYASLPGDILAPDTRLSGCTTAPCSNPGNGSGRIDIPAGLGTGLTAATQEGAVAFAHMSAADLISNIDLTVNTAPTFGVLLPEANIGGGFWLGFSGGAAAGVAAGNLRLGHYLVLNGTTATVAAGTGALSASEAARLDRKMDDGLPLAGSVQAANFPVCVAAGGGVSDYDESNEASTCSLYFRIQG